MCSKNESILDFKKKKHKAKEKKIFFQKIEPSEFVSKSRNRSACFMYPYTTCINYFGVQNTKSGVNENSLKFPLQVHEPKS